MKTTRISNRDWELLSEYVDNQLSQGKKTRLEARFRAEPELKQALADLRRTRAMLRTAPRLKAPRSFRLTPEMVSQPQRRSRPIYPIFQFTSALAGILLVLVLVGDFLQPMRQTAATAEGPVALQVEDASKQPEEGLAMESAPMLEEQAVEQAPGEANRSMATAVAEAPASADMLAATPTPELAAGAMPAEASPVGEALLEPPAIPTATEEITMMAASPLSDTISSAQSVPLPEAWETVEISPSMAQEAEAEAYAAEAEEEEGFALPAVSGWLVAEISLGVIMVLAALAAWYFRRSGA